MSVVLGPHQPVSLHGPAGPPATSGLSKPRCPWGPGGPGEPTGPGGCCHVRTMIYAKIWERKEAAHLSLSIRVSFTQLSCLLSEQFNQSI